MHSNTLQGVFPDPKPAHRKNFIKENVRYIKQMQGLVQSINPPRYTKDTQRISMQVPSKVISQLNGPGSKHGSVKLGQLKESFSTPISESPNKLMRKQFELNRQHSTVGKDKIQISQMREFGQVQRRMEDESPEKFTDRSVQTEKSDDVRKIYQNGVIKFPSASVVSALGSSRRRNMKTPQRHQDRGDSSLRSPTKHDLSSRVQSLDLEDRDFIKENMKAVKQKAMKSDANNDPNRAPPNYQRGVLPKYLKERKDEITKGADDDPECPPGHVLLPDEERKETLRVLRQSYADRIQELNSMPVRNDTLKMRKRKMDLEEELKKIDEGIKVFQRPKVFVKINA